MRFLFAALIALTPALAHAEGMPQLAFHDPRTWAQVVWGAIIFAVFYLLVSRWGLKQVEDVLAHRESTIAADLNEARAAKAAADRAQEELRETRRQAFAEAQRAVSQASERAKAEAAARTRAMEAELDARLRESEAEVARARAQALGSLHRISTETGEAVLSLLIGQAPDRVRLEREIAGIMRARGQAVPEETHA